MEKPTPQARPAVYSYTEIMRFVEQKHGFDSHDVASSSRHFYDWCDKTGKGQRDPQGKARGSSQLWFSEYQGHPEGASMRPPYQNFWHWLGEAYELQNGCEFTFEVAEHLEEDDLPPFVRTILEYIRTEFGDSLPCEVSW